MLDCPEQFSSVADYGPDARGETSDPLEAARKALEGYGLESDDVFERAGYPEADIMRVRLVRAREPLAVVDLIDDGTGSGWRAWSPAARRSRADRANLTPR